MASAPAHVAPRGSDFLDILDRSKGEIAKLLPPSVKVDRVLRVVRTSWQMDAKLQQCSPKSILSSVMKACELGLEPSGALKHCYLVPFKGEATLILGYAGLLELARRSGQYEKIETRVVYEKDQFLLEYNPDVLFRHVPYLDGPAGPEKFVYAFARLKGGELSFEVMTREQIEAIRGRLPEFQRNSPAWRDFWGEMARKIVLKRLLKRMPLSVEAVDAIGRDDEVERVTVEARPIEVERPALSRTEALAERFAGLPGPEEMPANVVEPRDEPTAEHEPAAPVRTREPGETTSKPQASPVARKA
jgi:recombination protein RecT